jgi:hypothetical protein
MQWPGRSRSAPRNRLPRAQNAETPGTRRNHRRTATALSPSQEERKAKGGVNKKDHHQAHIKELQDENSQVLRGAENIGALTQELAQKNVFYQPCPGYSEEQLLDTVRHAKPTLSLLQTARYRPNPILATRTGAGTGAGAGRVGMKAEGDVNENEKENENASLVADAETKGTALAKAQQESELKMMPKMKMKMKIKVKLQLTPSRKTEGAPRLDSMGNMSPGVSPELAEELPERLKEFFTEAKQTAKNSPQRSTDAFTRRAVEMETGRGSETAAGHRTASTQRAASTPNLYLRLSRPKSRMAGDKNISPDAKSIGNLTFKRYLY